MFQLCWVGPNITGRTTGESAASTDHYQGAFFQIQTIVGNGGGGTDAYVGFDASRVSSLYGSSNEVQPASHLALACIKF